MSDIDRIFERSLQRKKRASSTPLKPGGGWWAVHANVTHREIMDTQIHHYFKVYGWEQTEDGQFHGLTDGAGSLFADQLDDFIAYAHPDQLILDDYATWEARAREFLSASITYRRSLGVD